MEWQFTGDSIHRRQSASPIFSNQNNPDGANLRRHAQEPSIGEAPQDLIRELANERFVLNDRKYSPPAFDKVITLCAEAEFSPKIGATATVSPGVVALVEAEK